MRRQLTKYVLAVSFILALPLLALAAYTYTAFDYVGVLFGTTVGTATITEAFGINNSGKIVGGFCADADPKATTAGCSAPGNAPSHGYVRFKNGAQTIFAYTVGKTAVLDSMSLEGAAFARTLRIDPFSWQPNPVAGAPASPVISGPTSTPQPNQP